MSIIPLTIFFSLLLAGLFVALFARERSRRHLGGSARESLLPLADETPRVVGEEEHRRGQHDHDHPHEHGHAEGARCGCRDGSRPPCTGCLRAHARSATHA